MAEPLGQGETLSSRILLAGSHRTGLYCVDNKEREDFLRVGVMKQIYHLYPKRVTVHIFK